MKSCWTRVFVNMLSWNHQHSNIVLDLKNVILYIIIEIIIYSLYIWIVVHGIYKGEMQCFFFNAVMTHFLIQLYILQWTHISYNGHDFRYVHWVVQPSLQQFCNICIPWKRNSIIISSYSSNCSLNTLPLCLLTNSP